MYIVFFCLFITRGLVALAMRDEDRKSALFYSYLILPGVSILTGIILHMVCFFQGGNTSILALSIVSMLFAITSLFLFFKAITLVKIETQTPALPQHPRERTHQAADNAGRKENPKTLISIPYYLVRTAAEGCLFRPADRFDLLKISVKMINSKKTSHKALHLKERTPLFGKSTDTSKKYSKASVVEHPPAPPPINESPTGEIKFLPSIAGLKNKFIQFFLNKPQKEANTQPLAKIPVEGDATGKNLHALTNGEIVIESKKELIAEDIKIQTSVNPPAPKLDLDGDQCITCCNSKFNSVFLPCLHGGLCFTCAQTAFAQRSCCPLCNSKCLATASLEETLVSGIFKVSKVSLLPITPKK